MATYQQAQYVTKQVNNAEFDKIYEPGQIPPHSGIYKCQGCGHEIVAEQERSFPTQNHRQHTPAQGKIRWRLLVYAQHQATL